jgi:uncharacterized membrane protein YhaH (DUF805 family)
LSDITWFLGGLFSFRGRLNRSQFWTRFLLVNALLTPVVLVSMLIPDLDGKPVSAWGAALDYLIGITFWANFLSLCCRRLHDIGKSGRHLWSLGIYAGVVLLSTLVKRLTPFPRAWIFFVPFAVAAFGYFMYLIFLIFLKPGKQEENFWGPAPKGRFFNVREDV